MFVEALADAVEKGGGIGLARLIEKLAPGWGAMTWPRPTANFLQSLALNTSQGRVDLPVSKSPMGEGDRP